MSDPDSIHDVFLSHNSKDKAAVRAASLSASNRERMWCRNGHFAVRPKEAGLRLWFDEWVLPVAASRQSAAFSPEGQTRDEEDGGALPRRRYAAKIEERLLHSQLALQPSPFTLPLTPHQGLPWRNLPGSTGCRL